MSHIHSIFLLRAGIPLVAPLLLPSPPSPTPPRPLLHVLLPPFPRVLVNLHRRPRVVDGRVSLPLPLHRHIGVLGGQIPQLPGTEPSPSPPGPHERTVRRRIPDIRPRMGREQGLQVVLQSVPDQHLPIEEVGDPAAALGRIHGALPPPFAIVPRRAPNVLGPHAGHERTEIGDPVGNDDECVQEDLPVPPDQGGAGQHGRLAPRAGAHHLAVERDVAGFDRGGDRRQRLQAGRFGFFGGAAGFVLCDEVVDAGEQRLLSVLRVALAGALLRLIALAVVIAPVVVPLLSLSRLLFLLQFFPLGEKSEFGRIPSRLPLPPPRVLSEFSEGLPSEARGFAHRRGGRGGSRFGLTPTAARSSAVVSLLDCVRLSGLAGPAVVLLSPLARRRRTFRRALLPRLLPPPLSGSCIGLGLLGHVEIRHDG
mmetsp:Transcript_62443/g.184728  ORF Transcript_62443/g.184728 Transcript_62443/m.184728 type:complete len:423 (-) Transcript_62443:256-1524(-)